MIRRLAAIAGIIVLLAIVVALAYLLHQHRLESDASPAIKPEGPVVRLEPIPEKEIPS